jgi:hypothetical protein
VPAVSTRRIAVGSEAFLPESDGPEAEYAEGLGEGTWIDVLLVLSSICCSFWSVNNQSSIHMVLVVFRLTLVIGSMGGRERKSSASVFGETGPILDFGPTILSGGLLRIRLVLEFGLIVAGSRQQSNCQHSDMFIHQGLNIKDGGGVQGWLKFEVQGHALRLHERSLKNRNAHFNPFLFLTSAESQLQLSDKAFISLSSS